jgi:hypothetical protein
MAKRVIRASKRSLKDTGGREKKSPPAEACYSENKGKCQGTQVFTTRPRIKDDGT